MLERHPIDERFRQLLAKAEADPPAAVWEQLAARQQRKRRASWWSSKTLALLLGGTALVGGAAWWSLSAPVTEERDAVVAAAPTSTPNTAPASTSTTPAARGADGSTSTASASVSAPAQATSPEPASTTTAASSQIKRTRATADQPLNERSRSAAANTNNRLTSGTHTPDSRLNTSGSIATITGPTDRDDVALVPTVPASIDGDDRPMAPSILATAEAGTTNALRAAGLERMRTVLRTAPLAATLTRRTAPHYRVPPAEWWLALHVGSTTSRSTWYGEDQALSDALNDGEGWQQQVTWGGALGRQWRSGFGLSLGVMTDRSERGFRHTDRTIQEDRSIESYYVTLNGQVFVSAIDTIVTTTAVETVTQGVDRRSTVRIPVLAHWQQEWRRWSVGLRMGPTVEFTRAEAGPGILRRSADQLGAGTLTASQRQERYPATVLGLTGLDLGWRLHEHWTIQAGYLALWPISAVQPRSPVYATTLRHGAELRLILHLPARP
jgi:hypothetical protein